MFVKPEHITPLLQYHWFRTQPNMYIIPLDETDELSWKLPDWIRPEGGCGCKRRTGSGSGREWELNQRQAAGAKYVVQGSVKQTRQGRSW
jgi:hypothetical protein